ncbi:MAG: hypothetical protein JRI68_13720 [Deltaproteobacteria bacterium]|nr:hypothetical protein [Deltaproteobacteria bacterium]
MNSFGALIVERGAATLEEVELGIASLLLLGGDLGTNLLDHGFVKEGVLQELWAEYHEMAAGPVGQLPPYPEGLEELLDREAARRLNVHPLERTERTLRLAVSGPLDPDTEKQLRGGADLQLRLEVVTPLRLSEAISRSCDAPLGPRDQRLLDQIEAGETPKRGQDLESNRPVAAMFGAAAPYRRMAESSDGIAPSEEQPTPRIPRSAAKLLETVPPPETLDGVGPADEPSEEASASLEADGGSVRPPPGSAEAKRITQPWSEDDEEDEEDEEGTKRNTQPWRDDDDGPEEDPVSIRGEFDAQLSVAPPSEEAKISEEHRSFRHRGPFTRAQAELAVSQAPDVQVVLEVLVRYARQFFERCVLLVVRGDHAELRLSYGLTADSAAFALSLAEPSIFAEAVESGDPVLRPFSSEGLDVSVQKELAVGNERVAVIPLTIRERVVSLFYGDDRADGVDRDAVADVTDFTEICAHEITRLIIRLKRRGR